MVVHDLHIMGAGQGPSEANAELIVHADAMLASTVALERFEPIARWHPKIIKLSCDLQLPQLAPRRRFDANESPDLPAIRQSLRIGAFEGQDHYLK
jgi:hypothetical protein